MSILITVLLAVWMIVALLMILVTLMQRPKSEGLGAAFGGGVTENIFGAQTTNVLVKFTGYLAASFFILTFLLSILYARRATGNSGLRQELMKTQPAATASVVPGTGQPSPAASAVTGSPNPAVTPNAPAPTVAPPANVQVSPAAAAAPAGSAVSPSASPKP